MSIIVRPATSASDWDLGLNVLRGVYVGEGHVPAEKAAQTYQRSALEPHGTFLIAAQTDGTVIGALILLHARSSMQQVAVGEEREFRLLAVTASARGKGAGGALVQACIQQCERELASGLVLWTRPVMRIAQRLYERLGFVREPHRDTNDPRGFSRLVYLKKLR